MSPRTDGARSRAAVPPAAAVESAVSALARLYDLEMEGRDEDLDLYLALAGRTGGPILELASGSGRIAVPLAAAGYEVTGLEIDPAMIARARERAAAAGPAVAKRLTLVEGDARSTRLTGGGRFGLAVVALNSLFLFGGRSDQAAAVATLAAHLAPGGLAVVDVALPDADDLARYDGRLTLELLASGEPDGAGRIVTKLSSATHDAAHGTVRLTATYEEGAQGEPPRRWVREDLLRLVAADELAAFAEAAGLEVELVAGGYDLHELAPGDDRAILVARRP